MVGWGLKPRSGSRVHTALHCLNPLGVYTEWPDYYDLRIHNNLAAQCRLLLSQSTQWCKEWTSRRPIFLSGPCLSIEEFFKIKGYKNFHDTSLKKMKYLGYLFFTVLLKHFWKYNCLKAILHDCWCYFNEKIFLDHSVIWIMNGECVFPVLSQDANIFGCRFILRQGRHWG